MDRKHYDVEHEAFGAAFRAFAEKVVVPRYDQFQRDGITARDVFQEAGRSGFLAMEVAEEYGGGGVDDFRFNQVLAEQVAAAGVGGSGMGIALHNDICLPYLTSYATAEQRGRWLPGVVSGELITAVAMTEPGAGSDRKSVV